MRYRAKADVRQPEIVAALRKAGASVCVTSGLGKGFPDFIAGRDGVNLFFELKSASKISHRPKGKLTADQVEWHSAWKGQVAIIETAEEALTMLEEMTLPPHKPQYMSIPKDTDIPF